jgi:hypothetical protein
MKNFADPTDTGISDARARWKDLSSRLMKLPRLPKKGTSSERRHESEEMIKECIIVKDEAGDLSSADDSDGRKAKRRVKTHRKGKRVAKLFVLDGLGCRPEVEDIIGATNKFEVKRSGNEVTEPFNTEGRTKKAWADTGDGHD